MASANRPLRVFVVAAEPSGDMVGAELIRALRAANPNVEIAGVGREAMAAEGVATDIDLSALSVLGLFDGLRVWRQVHERANACARAAAAFNADQVVLIDSWGFMLRVAWKVREACPGARIVKYIGPQAFATRPGRAKTLARAVDNLLAIHPFDPEYFEPYGLPTIVVGNPALERDLTGDGAGFRRQHAIADDARVMLVLFGSRKAEVERLFDDFADTAEALAKDRPDLRLVTVVAPSVAESVRDRLASRDTLSGMIVVGPEERLDAFAAADAALACSGTVTLELSRMGVPGVVGYRLGPVAWTIAWNFMLKAPYVSLVNLAAGRELLPERLQNRAVPEYLVPEMARLLDDAEHRRAVSKALVETTKRMAGNGEGASVNAARALIDLGPK
ncbi:lipid-A-disaccharide synthase [Glycocaulis abyssi]|uniref:Lipid-A-disaccharide synthase n=1 Tax=Glycocaulis abyssi TaxID=1433403 RepID=A0ABV9N7U9_9PROT